MTGSRPPGGSVSASSQGGGKGPRPREERDRAERQMPLSRPPLSDQPLSVGAVRRYEDPELLERAWLRLEKSSLGSNAARGFESRRRLQLTLAAAVFGLGIFVGRFSAPGQEARDLEPSVASEDLTPSGRETAATGVPGEAERDSSAEGRGSRSRAGRPPSRVHQLRRAGLPKPAHVAEASDVREVEDAQAEAEQELALEAKATEPATERASWLILAERGDFAAAFSELDQGGTFQAVLQASSAEELMTLADVARFAGRDGRAIMALRQVTERYRDDPNAPLAAMMLGNLLSRAGDREGARAAYALNRTLSPDGDFAEDALVRELDLVLAERDLERAEKLLQKYETEFPSGSRLAAVRAEVEVLRAELDNEQADEGAESTQDEPLEAPAPATEDGGQEDGEADQREEAPGQRPAHQSAQPSPDSPLVDDGAASPPGPRDPVDGLD